MGEQKFEEIGKLLVLDYINMRANGKERPLDKDELRKWGIKL